MLKQFNEESQSISINCFISKKNFILSNLEIVLFLCKFGYLIDPKTRGFIVFLCFYFFLYSDCVWILLLSKNEYISTQTTNQIIHTIPIYNLIYGNEKISRCASSRHNFVVFFQIFFIFTYISCIYLGKQFKKHPNNRKTEELNRCFVQECWMVSIVRQWFQRTMQFQCELLERAVMERDDRDFVSLHT